ncbi:hypothetical protein [Oricola sp.]|uniref:hypothetical protein n=1 Tax=Oricola sp. TaxID=1979950 RepID=UPI0025DA65B3|nr:hypothetical protein [Oricola sp.]MCI5076864.1 hypothetical protein [Oricola sp.]
MLNTKSEKLAGMPDHSLCQLTRRKLMRQKRSAFAQVKPELVRTAINSAKAGHGMSSARWIKQAGLFIAKP